MGRSLEGKVALVTGASQGGTGTAIATRFAAEGAKVAIVARNEAGLRDTLAAIEAVGGTGLVLPADLGDHEARMALIPETERVLGPVDILVNDAMNPIFKPVEQYTLEDLDAVAQVNLWAPWLMSAQVLPGMRERGRGWILNLTSSAAEHPTGPPYGMLAGAMYGSYSVSKAALNRLTTITAAETEGQGIAVNALTPQASVATPVIVASGHVDALAGGGDASWIFEPLDAMAEAALALCSGDPSVLTGRIAYSLQLLLELDRPMYDLTGTDLVDGWQPADLPAKIRRKLEFHHTNGGPGPEAFDRPQTPWPPALGAHD